MKTTLPALFFIGLAAVARAADPAPAAGADALSVTVTGAALDEVPIVKEKPAAVIGFDSVASLSREGQTERVLTGPVEHMTGEDQMSLLRMDSRQALTGLPIRIPAAPYVRMEISPGLFPSSWELQVLDQNDKAMKALGGQALPKHVIEWDGFQDGVFKLHPGPAYTPVLLLTDQRKKVQRVFGEPVRFSALQYIQDGQLLIEFDNGALFERGRATLAEETRPLLEASLDLLRRHLGKPIKVVLFAAPGNAAAAQKRLDALKAFYQEGLILPDDALLFSVQPLRDRGDVTQVQASAD